MQFTLLAFTALAAIAAADVDLPEIIEDFPGCALPCLVQKAGDEGCKVTDFECICANTVSISTNVGLCIGSDCSATDAGQALGELCVRWTEDPPTTEVAAASSTLAALVSSASATASAPSPTKNIATGKGDVGMGFVGAIAAVVVLV
ncbi:hypothetical protein BJ170DRAFT_93933 [Xylariales sp. AK1849]|nr:hypothetical protein BJ170DRAFT_93933 [Xylariales sp. AK1849]